MYSAPVDSSLGAWGSFTNVYPVDFDSVTTAGTYTLSVTTPIAASSPPFKIDTAANLYSKPLANALYYYQTSRDGPNYVPNALRTAPGHLNDQSAMVYFTPTFDKKDNAGSLTPTGAIIDASGGWWDAGDYLKFVETHSYTVAMMLVGVRAFPNQLGAGSSSSNFTAEAQFGLDWLQKMWADGTKTLYYQVGVGSGGHAYAGDHDIWRLPRADDNYSNCNSPYPYICHRPVFVNTEGAGAQVSPNIAGRLAADFALCYKVFAVSNSAYANQCLLSAEHIFDLANTAPSGRLLTVGPFDFYPETEWRDDLELGATELYFALQGATNLTAGILKPIPCTTCRSQRNGPTPTSPDPMTRPTHSIFMTSADWPTLSSTAPSRWPEIPTARSFESGSALRHEQANDQSHHPGRQRSLRLRFSLECL